MPSCACVHHDGRMCARIRYNIPPDKWDFDDEVCECPCHDDYDEDGDDFIST
jgi:hypothetical protein